MYKYYIRVDKHDGYEQGIPILESMCETCLGVYHTGKSQDNPHWHFAIQLDVKTVPCLRARLRKFWSVPKSLSIKVFDGDEKGLKYLFHEKDRESFSVVSQKGYSEDDINSFKQESHSKSVKRSTKVRAPTFTERLVENAILEFGENAYIGNEDRLQRWVIQQFGHHRKVWDEYVIYKAYNVVAQHVIGRRHVEKALERLQTVIQRNEYRPS